MVVSYLGNISPMCACTSRTQSPDTGFEQSAKTLAPHTDVGLLSLDGWLDEETRVASQSRAAKDLVGAFLFGGPSGISSAARALRPS
ncbi:MAG TPA: hypothetical protein VNO21_07900 [Polyangiaceae bacterium]|nr:hypothetical protein [Polyangiaceae bacterium]